MGEPGLIESTFANRVELFLDSGPGGLLPSTVIDLTEGEPLLVRQGKGKV